MLEWVEETVEVLKMLGYLLSTRCDTSLAHLISYLKYHSNFLTDLPNSEVTPSYSSAADILLVF